MQVPRALAASDAMERALRMLDATPVTLTHKFGVLYVADGQRSEAEFLGNSGGSDCGCIIIPRDGLVILMR